ncbi:MAG: phosphomannomutase, partial [Ghiorsea sp.]
PVSCNSAVEKSGLFASVQRTKIGSPFVIEARNQAIAAGDACVVGYEANGGFLTVTDIHMNGQVLTALPTRDALIVPLALLMVSIAEQLSISQLLTTLPQRFSSSGRIQALATDISMQKIATLQEDASALTSLFGDVLAVNDIDGLRFTFVSQEVVHLRPSGNAPELRCYVEADSEARAEEIKGICLTFLAGWKL